MKSVFISYSQQDRSFRDALLTHLHVLQHRGLITAWHDGELTPGAAWRDVIDDKLRDADIIIILVSADFLASRFCQEVELAAALERWERREVIVVPVIVRDCDWQASALATFQALPTGARPVRQWADPDDAWACVARQLRAMVETAAAGLQLSTRTRTSPRAPARARDVGPQSPGIALGNRATYENFSVRFADAPSIAIHAYSMQTLVTSFMSFFVRKATEGCKLRFLLLNPNSAAVSVVAGVTEEGAQLRQDIERTVASLHRLLAHTNVELRFTPVPSPFGLVVADAEGSARRVEVELYAYDVVAADRPHFTLTPERDGPWYEFFLTQFERLWKSARPYVAPVPAPIPKPQWLKPNF